MKAFQFRLEPALRWRATQLRLEREEVSRTARRISALQQEISLLYTGLRSGAQQLVPAGSAAFGTWDAWVNRTRRQITALDSELRQARNTLLIQTQKMAGTHQKLQVLENLKQGEQANWTREFIRETDAFADEAFLGRLIRRPR